MTLKNASLATFPINLLSAINTAVEGDWSNLTIINITATSISQRLHAPSTLPTSYPLQMFSNNIPIESSSRTTHSTKRSSTSATSIGEEKFSLKPMNSKRATSTLDPNQTPPEDASVTPTPAESVDGDPDQPLPPVNSETGLPTLYSTRTPLELGKYEPTLDPTVLRVNLSSPSVVPLGGIISELSSVLPTLGPSVAPSREISSESPSLSSTLLPTEIRTDLPTAEPHGRRISSEIAPCRFLAFSGRSIPLSSRLTSRQHPPQLLVVPPLESSSSQTQFNSLSKDHRNAINSIAPSSHTLSTANQTLRLIENIAEMDKGELSVQNNKLFLSSISAPMLNASEKDITNRLLRVVQNTSEPTLDPTRTPLDMPTSVPIVDPTRTPFIPTLDSTLTPSDMPTAVPTLDPTRTPSDMPTAVPTFDTTRTPLDIPTSVPTLDPTRTPSDIPTSVPIVDPTGTPLDMPTAVPTLDPTRTPSDIPTSVPTLDPTGTTLDMPTSVPTVDPTLTPSDIPTAVPIVDPTRTPSDIPTDVGILIFYY